MDTRVRKTAKGLVISGIGEEQTISNIGVGAFVAIAKDLSLLRDDLPQKRHEGFAAGFQSPAPVHFLQVGLVGYAAILLVHQRRFGTSKNLLPAQTIGHNEDEVIGLTADGNQGREEVGRRETRK